MDKDNQKSSIMDIMEKQSISIESVGLILKAVHFAAEKHCDQRRKNQGSSPYINHPISLSYILWHEGEVYDPQVIVVAMLHDTVEDTTASLTDIEREFGSEICQIVAEVTDDKSLPKARRKELQVEHSPHLSPQAKLIKLADKISNLRDLLASPPVDWSQERQKEYFEWAKRVIDGVRGSNQKLEAIFDDLYRQGMGRF